MRRAAPVVTLSVLALLAAPLVGIASAAAPAKTSSSPAEGARVSVGPSAVSVTFSTALLPPPLSTLTVAGQTCTDTTLSGDGRTITCVLAAALPAGGYDVDWSVVAALPDVGTDENDDNATYFTVDTTAPSLVSRAPAAGSVVQSPATVSATFDETLGSATTLVVKKASGTTLAGTAAVSGSGVTFTPSSAFTEAGSPYTVTVTPQDAAEPANVGAPVVWSFTVDATPPAVPAVLSFGTGGYVNSANVTAVPVSGTAAPGSTAVLVATDGSTTTAPTELTTAGDGTWSGTLDLQGLADGSVSVRASARDAAGNSSAQSAAVPATKDTVAPTTPTVTGTDPVNAAGQAGMTVSGTTEPLAGVTVTVTGTSGSAGPVPTAAAPTTGAYSADVDVTALPDGPLTVTVVATDAAGNTSQGTDTVTKDATAPGAPTVAIQAPVNDDTKSSRTVSGTSAEPDGSTVAVTVSDGASPAHQVSAATTVSGGAYAATVNLSSLQDGPVTAVVVVTDAAGNASPAGSHTVTKDTIDPSAPAFTAPAYVNASQDDAVTQGGTAEPGSSVLVSVTDGSHAPVTGTVTTAPNGVWSATLNLAGLDDGALTISVTATDAAGNESTTTSQVTQKDTVAPAAPGGVAVSADPVTTADVTVEGTGVTGDSVTVTVTSDGGGVARTATGTVAGGAFALPVSGVTDGTISATARATDPAGNQGPASAADTAVKDTTVTDLVSSVPAHSAEVQSIPTISGTFSEQLVLASSSVTLRDGGGDVLALAGPETLSGDKRTISAAPADEPLPDGAYTVTFAVTDNIGTADSFVVAFVVDSVVPGAPTVVLGDPVTAASESAAALGGTAEPGASVAWSVDDAATPGTAAVTGTSTADGAGGWSATPDLSGLADGVLTATAVASDAAGNASVAGSDTATKDSVVPGAPTVVLGDPVTAASESAAALGGTAEPGASVAWSVDDAATPGTAAVTGTSTADGAGGWSATPDLSGLADGVLTVTATQADPAGNPGVASDSDTATKNTAQAATFSGLPAVPRSGTTYPVSVTVHQTFVAESPTDTAYTGTPLLASPDGHDTLSCSSAVAGVASCSVRFGDLGPQTLTASDGRVAGSASPTVAPAGLVFSSGPTLARPGVAATYTVVPIVGVSGASTAAYTASRTVTAAGATLSSATCTTPVCTVEVTWSTPGTKSVAVSDAGAGLSTTRSVVARYGTTVTLAAPTGVVSGTTYPVSGVLRNAQTGEGVRFATVNIFAKVAPATTYTLVKTVRTSSTGAYSTSLIGVRNTTLFVSAPGSASYDPATAPTRAVRVATRVTLTAPAAGSTIARATAFTVTGRVSPRVTGTQVTLFERRSGGTLVQLGTALVRSDSTFAIRRAAGLGAGKHTLLVRVAATATNVKGVSAARSITVT